MGGPSKEHEVSLNTGKNILLNLDSDKYEGIPVIIDREGNWEISIDDLKHHADVVFIGMHGHYGEDGKLQSELDSNNLIYTGSDPHASALAMNKFLSLKILRENGFNVPQMYYINKMNWINGSDFIIDRIKSLFEFPLVIKPNAGGSSIGISILEDDFKLRSVLEKLFEENKDILVQPYIDGREFTCAVLDHGIKESSYPLIPVETEPKLEFFLDYNSKYTDGGFKKNFPEDLSDIKFKNIRTLAKEAHEILGCKGLSRSDFVMDKNGKIFILEVNTIPEMAKNSTFIHGAKMFGIEFDELISKIIESTN